MLKKVLNMLFRCEVCHGKKYLIMSRRDNDGNCRDVVERCDNCSVDSLNDEQAAVLAHNDGINCEKTYPCYLIDN